MRRHPVLGQTQLGMNLGWIVRTKPITRILCYPYYMNGDAKSICFSLDSTAFSTTSIKPKPDDDPW